MNPGLHYQPLAKRQLLVMRRTIFLDPEAGAGQVHDAEVDIGILSKEIEDLEYEIAEDVKFVGEMQRFVNFLSVTKYKSWHRTLALRHCEDAQSRILRELGDKPE